MNERILKALETLKKNQDALNKEQLAIAESLEIVEDELKNIQNKNKEDRGLELQKLMLSLSAELERWDIIDGEWCYNRKPVGVRAEGRDGVDGKPGRDGVDGKDGEAPTIKIGNVEDSDEHGGAKAKLRKVRGKNEYLLDLTLPRGPQGFMGFDAKINGKSAIEILAGNNISVTQEGKKVYINSLINPFELKIVDKLPSENISSSAIYFTPSPDPKEKNIFIESVYVNKGTDEVPIWDWEEIGSTRIDLSGYVQKSYFQLVENADGETGLSITWEV